MSVYQKLSNARQQFHTLQLKKTGHNKFAGYYYFELGDFLVPALKVLSDNGLVSVISFGKELASMKIIDISKPEEFVEITSPMAGAALKGAHDIQNLGAVETYTRRYLWVAALEIVEHDALDSSEPIGGKVVKQNALTNIGDSIPDDWKEYLDGVAQQVVYWVKQNNVDKAKNIIEEFAEKDQWDETHRMYLHSLLDSKVRSALKK